MTDIIQYLNQSSTSPFTSKLQQLVSSSPQARASSTQWQAFIKALSQKGVKQLEIEDLGILEKLAAKGGDTMVTREELVSLLNSLSTIIKEVELGAPKFAARSQPGGKYHELLYIANSESAMIRDEINRIEDEMTFLGMEPERIDDDPELPLRLERERAALMKKGKTAVDYSFHHFSDIVKGSMGKNLLAHCRVSTYADQGLYFIQEIQSDWANMGRKFGFGGVSYGHNIPRGPFVTSTDALAGLVLRRQLQRAARDPAMKHFAWITESMRNGWTQNLGEEKRKREQAEAYAAKVKELTEESLARLALPADASAQTKAEALMMAQSSAAERTKREFGLHPISDDLNSFYLRTLPKIVDKTLSGTGMKTTLKEFRLGDRTVTVPSIEITAAVRAKLIEKQPLYSRGLLLRSDAVTTQHDDRTIARVLQEAEMLTGSPHRLRLALRLIDTATGRDVAGKYINEMVQVSLQAKNILEVTRHECFHYAQDCLLSDKENSLMERAFAPGTELHARVVGILTERSDFELAKHCQNPRECAAQGFALWCDGSLQLLDSPHRSADAEDGPSITSRVLRVFTSVKNAVVDVTNWLAGDVVRNELKTVESVFESLATGVLAHERSEPKDGLDRHARYRALSETPM